jgi:hypothetical protein
MKALATLILYLSSTVLFASPTGNPTTISIIRTVTGATYINVVDSSLCNTGTFQIESTIQDAKNMLANAMLAFALNKTVNLEVRTDIGCTGWGTKLMGIYVNQ